MKTRQLELLAKALEKKQGARVRRTKSGYWVATDKGTASFHLSPSDVRAELNTRARIEKIGLVWPF